MFRVNRRLGQMGTLQLDNKQDRQSEDGKTTREHDTQTFFAPVTLTLTQ